MQSPSATPSPRFDPVAWNELYNEVRPLEAGYVFRQGLQLVRTLCTATSKPGERWADIGCGTGVLVTGLLGGGVGIVGVDDDPRMIAFARDRFRQGGRPGPPPFLSGRASCLPFRDDSLDGVVAVSLTGCLANLDEFLMEAYRVLRPEGRAILTFTNRNSALLWAHDVVRMALTQRRPDRLRRYRPGEVIEDCLRIGYRPCAIRYYNCCITIGGRALPSAQVARLCDQVSHILSIGKGLARNFVVVAQKLPRDRLSNVGQPKVINDDQA